MAQAGDPPHHHPGQSAAAIATTFRDNINPAGVQVSITSARDLANIEAAAAADPRYLVTVYSYRRYYDGIFPYNLLPYNYPGVSSR